MVSQRRLRSSQLLFSRLWNQQFFLILMLTSYIINKSISESYASMSICRFISPVKQVPHKNSNQPKYALSCYGPLTSNTRCSTHNEPPEFEYSGTRLQFNGWRKGAEASLEASATGFYHRASEHGLGIRRRCNRWRAFPGHQPRRNGPSCARPSHVLQLLFNHLWYCPSPNRLHKYAFEERKTKLGAVQLLPGRGPRPNCFRRGLFWAKRGTKRYPPEHSAAST